MAGGAAVADEGDVGGEQGQRGVEVAGAHGEGEATGEIPVGVVGPALERGTRLADAAAGPAGGLAAGLGGAADDLGDLGEGHGEHVGEEEHRPVLGAEGVEHHQEAEGERGGPVDDLGRVRGVAGRGRRSAPPSPEPYRVRTGSGSHGPT